MSLSPLIDTTDLQARGIPTDDATAIFTLIDSASDAIRGAAGCAITRATSRFMVTGSPSTRLKIPLSPLRAVGSASIDGQPIVDYKLVDDYLWRRAGWQPDHSTPSTVELEVDHGYDLVPADVVSLACSLVAAGLAAMEDGYDPGRGISAVSIDDYRESSTRGEDEIIDPFDLPERTRRALRQRFNPASSGVVATR